MQTNVKIPDVEEFIGKYFTEQNFLTIIADLDDPEEDFEKAFIDWADNNTPYAIVFCGNPKDKYWIRTLQPLAFLEYAHLYCVGKKIAYIDGKKKHLKDSVFVLTLGLDFSQDAVLELAMQLRPQPAPTQQEENGRPAEESSGSVDAG